ncbi:hypothetical protein, partial [Bacteroides congonensis]|uniref:hypothetical protein n=1 Tax=Bacteroides congonensis TaxID=1871006 RepID=UPI00321B20A9
ENWSKVRLDIEGTYELTDIIWDGRRYVMVGSREEVIDQEYIYHGFIAVTENLVEFNIIYVAADEYSRYYAVIEKDGKYIIISREHSSTLNGGVIVERIGDIENWASCLTKKIAEMSYEVKVIQNGWTHWETHYVNVTNECKITIAKNNLGGILYLDFRKYKGDNTERVKTVYWTPDWNTFGGIDSSEILSCFACKGKTYFYNRDRILFKVNTDIGEKYNTGSNVFYTDAVYYDKCEIFLNENGIVIVRNKEDISEKTENDLIEITYDFSMKLIVKAFTGLYILGTGGNILKSNNEAKNEEALAVKTMSAFKALYDARLYTDEKYTALEARIAALETAGTES